LTGSAVGGALDDLQHLRERHPNVGIVVIGDEPIARVTDVSQLRDRTRQPDRRSLVDELATTRLIANRAYRIDPWP